MITAGAGAGGAHSRAGGSSGYAAVGGYGVKDELRARILAYNRAIAEQKAQAERVPELERELKEAMDAWAYLLTGAENEDENT